MILDKSALAPRRFGETDLQLIITLWTVGYIDFQPFIQSFNISLKWEESIATATGELAVKVEFGIHF